MFIDYLNESKGHVKNLKRTKRLNEYYDPEDDRSEYDKKTMDEKIDAYEKNLIL